MAQVVRDGTRGRVLRFVPRPPGAQVRARHGTRRATTVSSTSDEVVNAAWDRLRVLTEEAWIWRDPESIAAIKAALGRLERQTLREWYG